MDAEVNEGTQNVHDLENLEDVLSLPNILKFKDRSLLPPEPGIYFFIFENRILYIGQSDSLVNRCLGERHHVYPKILNREQLKIAYLIVNESEEKRALLEKELIDRFLPELNGNGGTLKTEAITIKLTLEEKQQILNEIAKRGIGASTWGRNAVLHHLNKTKETDILSLAIEYITRQAFANNDREAFTLLRRIYSKKNRCEPNK